MTPEELAIKRGYPPEAHRVVCVDYDGTLFPWGTLDGDPDPLPGAVAAMRRLAAHHYRLLIYTSRLSPTWLTASGHSEVEMRNRIEAALAKHGIPYHGITAEKVPAIAYIDDRAIRYADNWPEIADWLLFAGSEA